MFNATGSDIGLSLRWWVFAWHILPGSATLIDCHKLVFGFWNLFRRWASCSLSRLPLQTLKKLESAVIFKFFSLYPDLGHRSLVGANDIECVGNFLLSFCLLPTIVSSPRLTVGLNSYAIEDSRRKNLELLSNFTNPKNFAKIAPEVTWHVLSHKFLESERIAFFPLYIIL